MEQRRVGRKVGIVVAGAGLLSALTLAARAGLVRGRRLTSRAPRYRFNASYREHVTLRNGMRARIRMIRPADKPLLQDGMRRISAETRYRRFHVPKPELSEAELRYLTELDGINHLALGAETRGRRPEGLGVARFVRRSDRPDTAETAIVVRDDVQNQGLGTLLLKRLLEAAPERGIRCLECEVQADNEPALEMLRHIAPGVTETRSGAVVTLRIPTA